MTLSDLGSLGSFVSGLAILISLIYVSVQLRQAAKHQRALMMQGRAARVQNLWLSVAGSPELASVHHKMITRPELLTDSEMAQTLAFATAYFASLEETWLEGRESLQSKAVHEVIAVRIARTFTLPFFRATWPMLRPTLDPEFVEVADRLLRETKSDPTITLNALRQAIASETAKWAESIQSLSANSS